MQNVSLTKAAEEDLIQIWLYTFETWGIEQADKYYDQIVMCCEAIGDSSALSKLVEGLQSDIHVHRCQKHYMFFLISERPIVLAILHERMDFIKRLQESF